MKVRLYFATDININHKHKDSYLYFCCRFQIHPQIRYKSNEDRLIKINLRSPF